MSRHVRRALLTLGAATVLSAALAAVPQQVIPTLPIAGAVADCQVGPGQEPSNLYRTHFSPGRSIDHWLRDYVPQGLGVWPNWNGTSEDLFLIGMHHRDEANHRSLVYGISKQT